MKSTSQPLVRSIQLSEMTIPYVLKHSKKARYLRMQISNNGELEVVLPRGFQVIDAEKFIYKKLDWIKKHLSQNRQSRNKISLLGRNIKVTQNYDLFIKNHKVKFGNDHLIIISPSGSKISIEEAFENWLRKLAKKSLVERVYKIANGLGYKIGKISIRGQKTRWGSCSTNGNLSFNYNLLRFRKEVIGYVIIHELCHLKEMNHSGKFWALVAEYCPQWRHHRKWLKDHETELAISSP